MSFSMQQKTKILSLKSAIVSYYNLQMKKIGNPQLDSHFYDHCVITGGCISSLFHNEPVNDIDVYAKTSPSVMMIKKYIIDNGKDIKSGSKYELNANVPHIEQPWITENAVTLTNDVQFIYLGTAEDCRVKFDFVHCMPWFDIQSQKLHISESQYAAIESKTLIQNVNGHGANEKRIEKYAIKGWNTKNIVHKFPDVV
jgi:hypothetical protein